MLDAESSFTQAKIDRIIAQRCERLCRLKVPRWDQTRWRRGPNNNNNTGEGASWPGALLKRATMDGAVATTAASAGVSHAGPPRKERSQEWTFWNHEKHSTRLRTQLHN